MSGDCETLRSRAEPCATGGTLREHGTGVSAQTPWRAFQLDSPHGRDLLGIGEDDRCADGIFLHDKPDDLRIIVVELKSGADLTKAVAQLRHTVLSLRELLGHCVCIERAAVVASGSAPPSLKRLKQDFFRTTSVILVFKSGVRKKNIPLAALPAT